MRSLVHLHLELTPDACGVIEVTPPPDADAPLRPGLLIDRDGVLVVDCGYLARPEHVRPIADARPTLAAARRSGRRIAVVTNQSGIGRGYYGWDEFLAVEREIARGLAAHGLGVDLVLACPHHPEACPPFRHVRHPWRKPNPGMLLEAMRRLRLDPACTWMIGDKAIDVEAAAAAGVGDAVLLAPPGTAPPAVAGPTRVHVWQSLLPAPDVL